MTTNEPRIPGARGNCFAVGARVLLLLAITVPTLDAAADERVAAAATRAAALTGQGLERAFWWCDHAAATRGVGLDEGSACRAVYEELKSRRFSGDFEALVAWWRANKAAEFRKLDLAQRNDADLTADEDGLAAP